MIFLAQFHGNPIPKAWGPSKSGLVTDDVASDHLPSLDRPPLKSTNSEDIDALFDDDFELEGFEEESDETVKSTKPLEKREVEKPTGPGEPAEPEPVVLSGGESIDELEDFDTGLLSSGGSDYSF
uniref:AGC-kinase C-terminal domain-containing protein n=1 Tax=Caenorhabditis tropicalis TaxID=1561998 RepID=A0A1I7U3V9_9PELO